MQDYDSLLYNDKCMHMSKVLRAGCKLSQANPDNNLNCCAWLNEITANVSAKPTTAAIRDFMIAAGYNWHFSLPKFRKV